MDFIDLLNMIEQFKNKKGYPKKVNSEDLDNLLSSIEKTLKLLGDELRKYKDEAEEIKNKKEAISDILLKAQIEAKNIIKASKEIARKEKEDIIFEARKEADRIQILTNRWIKELSKEGELYKSNIKDSVEVSTKVATNIAESIKYLVYSSIDNMLFELNKTVSVNIADIFSKIAEVSVPKFTELHEFVEKNGEIDVINEHSSFQEVNSMNNKDIHGVNTQKSHPNLRILGKESNQEQIPILVGCMLKEDIIDEYGAVIAKKGSIVNPDIIEKCIFAGMYGTLMKAAGF